MFRHVVMWNYKKGFTDDENKINGLKVKQGLENLKTLIPEIIEIKVHINELGTSTKDIMLDSLFANEAAFNVYKDNPDHKKAGAITKEVLDCRVAFDYNE